MKPESPGYVGDSGFGKAGCTPVRTAQSKTRCRCTLTTREALGTYEMVPWGVEGERPLSRPSSKQSGGRLSTVEARPLT